MFAGSQTSILSACEEIADTVGASADPEMKTRAVRSLAAGIKYLNGRQNWSWLLTEAAPITIAAPFGVTLTAVASGVASASASAGHGVKVDDMIQGTGFALGTRVSATAASGISWNFATTGASTTSATVVRDFYDLPTDWKKPYGLKLLGGGRPLWPVQRRAYDRGTYSETSQGIAEGYDLFAGFQKNKLRLLPPPGQSDTLLIRYYRRMTVASASGDTSMLDIPQDYDFHLIAWAKWHFLVDKAEGRAEQATTWLNLANEGIKVMLADQTRQPDESFGFSPGHYTSSSWPLSTRTISWDYSG